jgi:hypothetical protein
MNCKVGPISLCLSIQATGSAYKTEGTIDLSEKACFGTKPSFGKK